MIRPQIVLYTEEWRPGVVELAHAVGWTEEMQTWEWNPLMTLLAVHKDRVVGFIAGWAGQPVGIMDALVVAPDVRGRGIGIFLLNAMAQRLFACGSQRVRCLTDNPALEGMMERVGYQRVSRGTMMEGVR